MRQDAFSRFHPWVNFLFFMGAIGFGVVVQHPAYLIAGAVCGSVYYLLLRGRKGIKLILGLIPMLAIITLVNPLFNHNGATVLFQVFGKPYTLEAMCYGAALGGMFVLMMIWFGCYSVVLTSDKFVCLFGNLIPSLSLLLVMVLRMIPAFVRKAQQIIGARNSIGKGVGESAGDREKLHSGLGILSALIDWALEGSIVTADSMRSRGYGCAKRTSFQIYRMTARDWAVIALEGALALWVVIALARGAGDVSFTRRIKLAPLTWSYVGYWVYLLIPTAVEVIEQIRWKRIRAKAWANQAGGVQ